MNDDDRFLILSDAPTLLKCNVNIQRFLAKPLDFLAAQATPVDERGFHSAMHSGIMGFSLYALSPTRNPTIVIDHLGHDVGLAHFAC